MRERELRVGMTLFFPPHGDCQRRVLSTLPNLAQPPTPTHLYAFLVTCLSTAMNWYKVNNLCGKDPKSPWAVCMVEPALFID